MRTIVCDFDGTLTVRDSLALLVSRFGDVGVRAETERELGKSLTLHEAISRQYASLEVTLPVARDWLLAHTQLRPGARDLVAYTQRRGWRLVVVSSGLRELIEPVLAQHGLDVELVANSLVGEPPPWTVEFDDGAVCPTCSEACKRRTVDRLRGQGELVYVGDGFSDACGAESADRVFARRRLAEVFRERGLAYEPFEDMHEVLAALAA